LFDHLENYEEETGEQVEFDPIALCCDYSEYDSFEDLQLQYPNIEDIDQLRDRTIVIELEEADGLIIQDF